MGQQLTLATLNQNLTKATTAAGIGLYDVH
jgi:hypothetical protein